MTEALVHGAMAGEAGLRAPTPTAPLRHRPANYGTRIGLSSHSLALLATIIGTGRPRKASATDLHARAIHGARVGLPTPAL